jgi:YVTN family beta-propeller protein
VIQITLVSLGIIFILMFFLSNVALGDSVIATIPVSGPPFWATYVPDNGKIYVTQSNSALISVIDGATNTVVNTISISYPFTSAFSTVDHMLYVISYWAGTIIKIDPSSDAIVDTISLGQISGTCVCPSFIAVNSVNGLLYIGGYDYSGSVPQISIFVVNPSTNSVVTKINVNFPVSGLAYNPYNNMLYASLAQNDPLDSVAVIDTSTNTVISNIGVDPAPFGVTVNPTNGMVYVASEHAAVTAITAANTVAATVVPPTVSSDILHPHPIRFNPDNGKVYVGGLTGGLTDYVFAIESSTNTINSDPLLPVGRGAHEIAYDSQNGNLYLPNWGSDDVSVISTDRPTPQSSSICSEDNVKHWDKIVFDITDPNIAKKLNLTANTELDIKVLDDPKKVADIKQKVLDFLKVPNENKSSIQILDVEYAVICEMSAPIEDLLVFSPAAFQSNSQFDTTAEGKLQITVRFNKAVDKSTVMPQQNLILNMERENNAAVTVNWNPLNTQATITTVQNQSALCNYDPDCFFRLTLDGTAAGVIKAEDGGLLNGGTLDYWTGFTIVG